jgi:hypothetical protein
LSSDGGGSLLLKMAEKVTGLLKRVSQILHDPRDPSKIEHTTKDLLTQRVFGIAMGYEDLNDHNRLREDPAVQVAIGKETELASSPTLCRFENTADEKMGWAIHKVFLETFIDSFKKPPKELILDFDGTDDPVHGNQAGAHFHGYYDNYCFLPLYVFCGKQLLVSYLRPGNADGARHAWGILSLLVKQLRKKWPDVRIIFRGDCGFCRLKMLSWSERHGVDYIVGLPGNKALERKASVDIQAVKTAFETTKEKQKQFNEFQYGAGTWHKERRVIVKAEYNDKGPNTRYIVTNMEGTPEDLYRNVYCARGDMENRIKEQQLYLFAGKTSCEGWWANQFRLLLSSLAYTLMETIRRLGLKGTEMASAQCHTIRNNLFKVAAVIVSNTRRIRFLLPAHYPFKHIFSKALNNLSSS